MFDVKYDAGTGFFVILYMGRQPAASKTKSAGLKTPSVKKLPAKKRAAPKKAKEKLVIAPGSRQYFSSIIELIKRGLPAGESSPMPLSLKPMLATLVDAPFTSDEWQFELKLDGYRALAFLNKGSVELRSRNENSFNQKFQPVYEALKEWNINAVLDGEIVVLNEEGKPDFNGIQQWDKIQEGQLIYYVFDIIWLDGRDLTRLPLYRRRDILRQLMPVSGMIRYSDHIDDIGEEFFEIARKNNLEGIIAKKKDAAYIPDSRSRAWLKIKIEEQHEAIICGYSKNRDTDRLFSSLVLGVYQQGRLVYIGQSGTGFTEKSQAELMKKMKHLVSSNMPFDKDPKIGKTTVWLEPELVCEVKYTELTKEGIMRHPSFRGLRIDKTAADLNNEQSGPTSKLLEENNPGENLASSKKEEQLVTIDDHELKLTNLNKTFWPAGKGRAAITKGDLLRYYYSMAEYIMPYMKDRPQSLNRFPNGINGESFYHKNMNGKVDAWLNTFKRYSDSNGEAKDFLICSNTASLIYMANLGCIEMNPWHSRAQTALYPDWCVIDLDPGKISFDKVIETANVVRQVLDSLQVPSYPKTSGSTGIHIYIPLGAKYNYEQSRQLAELIATLVHEELPGFTSLVRNPQKRSDKIYIDYLQNRPIQTICAPYSVRPKPGATVSAPLHWEEVKKGLKISDFHIKNMQARVKSEGDLFEGILHKGIDLNSLLKGLTQLI